MVTLRKTAMLWDWQHYRQVASRFSDVQCQDCTHIWRTDALYVDRLSNGLRVYERAANGGL